MFGNIEDIDITKDLVIDQLITSTKDCNEPIWKKVNFEKCSQYHFEYKITDKSKICFKLTHYLIHDEHTLNIWLSKNNGMVAISVLMVVGYRVLKLVETIETTKKYFYDRREN
jgi:hypothetical protein